MFCCLPISEEFKVMPDLDDATMKIVTRITSFDFTSDEDAGNNCLNLEEVSFFIHDSFLQQRHQLRPFIKIQR
jgi:hypothetical protein